MPRKPKIEEPDDGVIEYTPPRNSGAGKTTKSNPLSKLGGAALGGAATFAALFTAYLIKEGYDRGWAKKVAQAAADLIEKGGNFIKDKILRRKPQPSLPSNDSSFRAGDNSGIKNPVYAVPDPNIFG